jgi:hypothetical protein
MGPVVKEDVMAKKRTPKANNVVAMPVSESTPTISTPTATTDRDIARRAFEIFCERGCQHGHDVEDWLQAERELRGSETAVA